MKTRQQFGFTMTELMIAIAISVIIITVALPSFQTMLKKNALRTSAIELYTLLSIARSEAVGRNTNITLCRTVDPFPSGDPVCGGAGAWEKAWLVFEDADSDGVYDSGETVIRGYEVDATSLTATSADYANFITYRASGRPNGGAGSFLICDTDNSLTGRQVDVSLSGAIQISEASCP